MIDAHVHLWNRSTDPQPWIDPVSMAAIDRDFAAVDLEQMLAETGAGAAVVVQATNSLAETRRLLAGAGPGAAGVVGWIDLTADAGAQLDSLGADGSQRLVGIRHLVHVDPDPGWLGRPGIDAALDVLGARGLCFDLVLRPWQLSLAATVADAHPATRFVLDHLGGVADSTDDAGWESGLRALAQRPNVSAKISGLAALVADPVRLRRVTGVAIEAFGPNRLMYGSDWPLVRLTSGSAAWRTAVDELIADLNAGERTAILSGTASDCYGLAR
ncbi:amidohydrolase family protein [Actinoplanes friuliensis]|uniref:Amidohydrolase n=1 Tax=Actinoplanes friuliensis DSM 7358 TaxID=1246995 RepID=U5W7Y7_9ACTN|nr:amidohydrolase family protein [Actinoplanes friuliensis]AGZ44080.1 amidohydrolase [Actinoplanes friuliensis DSM 7358]